MKNLFKNSNEIFRKSIGSVSDVFQIQKMEASIASVERKLRDIISAEEYNKLIVSIYGAGPSREQLELITILRAAVGRLALVEFIPESNVSIGSGGLLVQRTKNASPASQYRTEKLLRTHRNKAHDLLDDAIEYLEKNTALFINYAESDERQKRRNGVIITPAQFRDVFGHRISHLVFATILPTIRMHEKNWLAQNVSRAFYEQLIIQSQRQTEGNDLADNYPEILRMAQEAVAHHAMSEAIPNLHVRIDEDGVTLSDNTYNSHVGRSRRSVQPDALSYLVRNASENAEARMAALVGELNDKASETLYPEYFHSDCYFDPEEDWRDDIPGGYFGL